MRCYLFCEFTNFIFTIFICVVPALLSSETKQMMTKAEVEAVVKRLFKEAKGGISQTKESLMIGLTPYRCLGCSDIFTGMNAMNASKVSWV